MELSDRLEEKFRIDVNQKRALRRLKLFTVHDLLFHFPVRYSDVSTVKRIEELVPGEVSTVYGKVSKLKTKKAWRSKMPMAEGQIEDLSGKIKIIWYNQAYLAKMLHEGESVKLTGKVTGGKRGMYLANPEFERLPNMPIDSHDQLFTPRPDKGGVGVGLGLSFPIYRVAKSVDRLQPILQNILTGGYSWRKHHITEEFIQDHKKQYMVHDPFLLKLYNALIKEARRVKILPR